MAILLSALGATGAAAVTLDSIGSFDQPIFVTSDPADSSRIFVVERDGRVAEVDGEGAVPQLYADLTAFVSCCASERGLLSIAPAPDFHKSGLFYAAYTGKPAAGGAEGDIHIDAFVANADAEVTRTPIISVGHSQQANHNGGQIQFGPDGYLYISTGDGGGGGDPFETGQSLSSLLGKILRIDPHPGSFPVYTVPPGPFTAGPGADEIWASGLRNPWRFSFDSLTGDLATADVGQNGHEEVDYARRPADASAGGGDNYGWSCREGLFPYSDSTPTANCVGAGGFTEPVFDYPHTDPDPPADRAYGCSITGGYVVRDPSLADLYGRYVYADYCTSEIRSLALPAPGEDTAGDDRSAGIATPTPNPVSFGEDSCHRLYVAAGSDVYRFEGAVAPECPKLPEEPPDEEPPGSEEEPPLGETPPITSAAERPEPPSIDLGPPAPTHVHLTADRRGGAVQVVLLVTPCASSQGARVQLNRGGRQVGVKRLGEGCRVLFNLRVMRRATFRGLLLTGSGATTRSQRFVLGPAPG